MSEVVADVPLIGAAVEPPRFLRRLLRKPLAVVCLAYLTVVAGIAIFAPIVMPDVVHQFTGNLLAARKGPTGAHLLGTDSLGRDVLDRLLVGARPTILGATEALIVVLLLGVPVGLAAGYLGGRTDRIVSWLADLTFSMPAIVIILAVLTVYPTSMTAAMVAFGLIASPGLMRIVRSAVLPVRQELYIDAARVSGLSRTYIITRHVLPRIRGPVIVQASLLASAAVIAQTALAFLGLVVKAPEPSWGGMVGDGLNNLLTQPWLIWPPGIAITITVLAIGTLGDLVTDASAEGWRTQTLRQRRRRSGGALAASLAASSESEADSGDRLLQIEGLTVAFPSPTGDVTVVENLSFEIRPGEALGLVGESGCGKTVTATSIIGMVPGAGEVRAGRILFDGRDLSMLTERALQEVRGKEIGLISQEPMISLNPVFRVGWQLAQAVRRHHPELSRREARRRAVELLRRVHLPDPEQVAQRYPSELSGGMAQRVAIARAIAGEPRLLIADEPTTALDVTVQAEILELLRELQRDRGMALLLVTHDWGVVADICERVVVMYAGEVVEQAALDSIVDEPLHPYTEALLESNPYHAPEQEILRAIPGEVPRPGGWPAGCHFNPRCSYATNACREQPIPLERPSAQRATRCIHYKELIAK